VKTLDVTVSPNRIAGIPPGTKAIVAMHPHMIDAGVLELTVTWPEAVPVTLWHPDYELAELKVTCAPDYVPSGDGITVAVGQSYRHLRRAEYPPIADQIDALWKGGAERASMEARVLAVKAKFPKPEPEKE
jgi:hypothetical protein